MLGGVAHSVHLDDARPGEPAAATQQIDGHPHLPQCRPPDARRRRARRPRQHRLRRRRPDRLARFFHDVRTPIDRARVTAGRPCYTRLALAVHLMTNTALTARRTTSTAAGNSPSRPRPPLQEGLRDARRRRTRRHGSPATRWRFFHNDPRPQPAGGVGPRKEPSDERSDGASPDPGALRRLERRRRRRGTGDEIAPRLGDLRRRRCRGVAAEGRAPARDGAHHRVQVHVSHPPAYEPRRTTGSQDLWVNEYAIRCDGW